MAKKMSTGAKVALIIVAIIVLIIAVGAVFVVSSINKIKNDMDASQTVTAEINDFDVEVRASGNIVSAEIENIKATRSGEISLVNIEVGDYVNQGEVLYEIMDPNAEETIENYNDQLDSMYTSLDMLRTTEDIYYIKAPAEGTIKELTVEDETMIEDAMDEYGYVALISTKDEMLATVEGNSFKQDDEYDVLIGENEKSEVATVIMTEDGIAEISIPTDEYDIGESISVLDDNDQIIATGELILSEYEYVYSNNGLVKRVNYDVGDDVDEGDYLYQATAVSSALRSQYDQIQDLKETIEEYKEDCITKEILAPFAGQITRVDFGVGDMVNENQPLAEITDIDNLNVLVEIDELDVMNVDIGQEVVIKVDALENIELTGTVLEVANIGRNSGGITVFETTVAIDEPGNSRIGMSSSVKITVNSIKDALVIPIEALKQNDENETYVMIVTVDEEGASTSEMRMVEVGVANENYIQILSGLEDGDVLELEAKTIQSGFMMGGGLSDRMGAEE